MFDVNCGIMEEMQTNTSESVETITDVAVGHVVGNMEEQARKRKERLMELRKKAKGIKETDDQR